MIEYFEYLYQSALFQIDRSDSNVLTGKAITYVSNNKSLLILLLLV